MKCRRCSLEAASEGLCASCGLRALRAARRDLRRQQLVQAPPQPLEDRLLLPAEVADRLRVTRSTVYRLLKAGRLRGVRVGRRVNVSSSSLNSFLRGSRIRRV